MPDEPEITRDESALTRLMLPGSIRITDAERREVEVCATSEAIDSYGTIFGYDASKDAFSRWFGNIREMHDKKAVGRKVDVAFDDADHKIFVRGRISRGAEDTWQKLQDGTLAGASIGASNVQWERRQVGGKLVPWATKYDLIELSLVDLPSNPDSVGVNFLRAAGLETPVVRGNAMELHNRPKGDGQLPITPHDPISAANHAGSPANVATVNGTGNGRINDHTPSVGDASEIDTKLREVEIGDGDGPFPQQQPDDDQAQLHPIGSPPAVPDDATFAASRPAGVLGSHTDHDAASQMASLSAPLPGNPGTPGFDGSKQVLPQGGGPGARSQAVAQPAGVAGGSGRGHELTERVAALAAESGVGALAGPGALAGAGALAPDPALAPYGYGATLAVNQGGRIPSKAEQNRARRAVENAARDAISAAGAQAESQFAPWDRTEDYALYLKRRAEARGRAEREVLLDQQAREIATAQATRRAAEQQSGQPSVAPWPPQPVAAREDPRARAQAIRAKQQEARQAQQAQIDAATKVTPAPTTSSTQQSQALDAAAIARLVDEAVAARLSETPQWQTQLARDATRAQTEVIGSTPSMANQGDLAALGTARLGHTHTHGHDGVVQHGTTGDHEHEHVHRDGTSHGHPHLHQHDHHDHHGELRASGASSHAHEHAHLHDHSHTYRAGQPTDTALLLADAARARQTAPLAQTSNRPVNPNTLHPVTGSAQSGPQGASPQMHIHPEAIGHLDLPNTEDASALGFGVPPEVSPVKTPAGLEITDPAGFHPGGHDAGSGALAGRKPLAPSNNSFVQSEAGSPTAPFANPPAAEPQGPMDDDLDHDADEDARERESATNAVAEGLDGLDKGARPQVANSAIVGTPSGITKLSGAGRRAAGMTLDGDDDDGGDGDMDQDGDHDADEDAGETASIVEGPPSGKAKAKSRRDAGDAEETRTGARISAESRAALHAARATQEQAVRNLCAHCGCEDCTAYTSALDQIADMASQRAAGLPAVSAQEFGTQRAIARLVAYDLGQQQEAQTQMLLARVADLELTLAETQRSLSAALRATQQQQELPETTTTQRTQEAEETRFAALETRLATALESRVAATITNAVAPLLQQVEASASVADETRALVEAIAEQPGASASGGPVAGVADKLIRVMDPTGGAVQPGVPSGGFAGGFATSDPAEDPEVQIRAIQAAARRLGNPAQQTQLAAIVANLQPQARRMLDGRGQAPVQRIQQRQLGSRINGAR